MKHLFGTVFCFILLFSVNVFSATITVTSTANTGPGTLYEAIQTANSNSGPDTIVFSVSGTITIIEGLPPLNDTTGGTIIDGGVNHDITIAGGGLYMDDGLQITSSNNVISGLVITKFYNGAGIKISGTSATNNQVRNCYIGVDSTMAVQDNDCGILINSGASNNIIGGPNLGDRNIISGNFTYGIYIQGSGDYCNNNQVIGNYIGTDDTGTIDKGNNVFGGIWVIGDVSNTQILNNLISGNDYYGIYLYSSINSVVRGNLIGTDVTGTSIIPNEGFGIVIAYGSFGNIIGGSNASDRNIISGNNGAGLGINNDTVGDGNLITGNYIGTDITGNNPLPNTSHGILIYDSIIPNTIGGTIIGEQNIIANNGGDGISFTQNNDNSMAIILPNKYFNNTGLAIDLLNDGITLNDAGDSDTGPNTLKNFPVITTIYQTGTNEYHVYGTAAPGDDVYLYQVTNTTASVTEDPTGYGEGFEYLAMSTADGSGYFSISGLNITEAPVLSVVAIDASGNTSEFGQNYSNVEIIDIVTVTGVGRAPATAQPGVTDILMQEMQISTNANTAMWTVLRINRTGTGTDADVSAVRVYLDNGDDTFDSGTDTVIGSGTFTSGTVDINITDQEITTTAKRYFISIDLASDAGVQHTIGTSLNTRLYFTVISPDYVDGSNFPHVSGNLTICSSDIDHGTELKIFPNPVKPGQTVRFVNLNGPGTIKILDTYGNLIKEIPFTGTETTWDLTGSVDPGSGVYIYHVKDNNGDKTGKIIILR